jgi:glycosyltransferase involved in cell wall biosynthesis
MVRKLIIAMDLSTKGKGGGPYTSTCRIMHSNLNKKYDFKTIHYRSELGSGISIKRIKDIVKQLKVIKPDIVHFSGLQLSGFHMAIACKLAGVKNTIVTVHGFSGEALYFNPLKKFLLKFLLEPLTLLLSKQIIGVSEYVISRPVIQFLAKKRSILIYNFPPKLNDKYNKQEIRKELGFTLSDVVVVSVARIIKDKGYHILDEAILEFINKPNLKFLIVGDGDYLKLMKVKLKEQVKKNQVLFLGYRSDISLILNACDIFVLPTLHETLSIALLEASQANLALIASDTGGVPEIVKNEHNGILVPTGNVEAIVSAIERLYNNNDLRIAFGNNAKTRIKEKFSNKEIVQKLDSVYQSLLN